MSDCCCEIKNGVHCRSCHDEKGDWDKIDNLQAPPKPTRPDITGVQNK